MIRLHAFFAAAIIFTLSIAGSCGKKSSDSFSSLPLITTSDELTAATAKAGSKMIVLDLYADWCGPCRMLAPTLDELAKETEGKADFYRINVDKSAYLAQSFGVQGIPHIVFMKSGSGVYALTGIHPKEEYQKIIAICDGLRTPEECIEALNKRL
jgi:thioredoxin 1